MIKDCFLVSSGEYSDYQIHCVFEHEDDATAYVRTYNENDLRVDHDKKVAEDYTPPNAQYKCADPIETCPGCGKYFSDLDHWVMRVQKRPFYTKGEIPIFPLERQPV